MNLKLDNKHGNTTNNNIKNNLHFTSKKTVNKKTVNKTITHVYKEQTNSTSRELKALRQNLQGTLNKKMTLFYLLNIISKLFVGIAFIYSIFIYFSENNFIYTLLHPSINEFIQITTINNLQILSIIIYISIAGLTLIILKSIYMLFNSGVRWAKNGKADVREIYFITLLYLIVASLSLYTNNFILFCFSGATVLNIKYKLINL